MDNRGLLDLIISLLPELRPAEKITLLKSFVHEEELYLHTKKYIEEVLDRNVLSNWDMLEYRNKADRIDTMCRKKSIKWVSWTDPEYPPLVREMYDPPAVLFYKGSLPDPEKSLLGMVGTRRPSAEAVSQAYSLGYGVGKEGISVVSGLALGIDAMSHRGNLCGGVPGYAVLGSGLDEIYPSTNRPLAKRLLESGGALISEYPPGTHPNKWNFPARNRIIAALSRSVIIIEAPKKSGALITASFALEQGKDLWVGSSGLTEQQYSSIYDKQGTIKLAAEGAEIIDSADDVFEKWNIEFTQKKDDNFVSAWDTCGKELAANMANFLKIEI